jgi:hypothetical protein
MNEVVYTGFYRHGWRLSVGTVREARRMLVSSIDNTSVLG